MSAQFSPRELELMKGATPLPQSASQPETGDQTFSPRELELMKGATPNKENWLETIGRKGLFAGSQIGAGLLGTPGNIATMVEAGSQKVRDYLRDVPAINKLLPSEESAAKAFKKKGPTTADILAYERKSPEAVSQPRSKLEQRLELPLQFVGGSLAFPGGAAPRALMAAASAGAGTQAAIEAGMGPWGQLGVGLIGAMVPGAAGATMKVIANPRAALVNAIGKGIAKNPVKQALIESARKAGVTLPASVLSDNRLLQFVESKLAASALTGKPLRDLMNTVSDDFVKSYNGIIKEISQNPVKSSIEMGVGVKDMLAQARDFDKQVYKKLYQESEELGQNVFAPTIRIEESLNSVEKKLSKGFVKSPEQKSVLAQVKETKTALEAAKNELGEISAADLIASKSALSDFIDYETQGGVKSLLKQVVGDIDSTIKTSTPPGSPFREAYSNANKEFEQHVKTYRNKLINAGIFAENPEQLLSKMTSVSNIRSVEKALGFTAEGKSVFQDLKAFKLQEMLEKNVVNEATGRASFNSLSTYLKNGPRRQILAELLGTKGYQDLARLSKVGNSINEGLTKFLNASQTATTAVDITVMNGILKAAISSVMTLNPVPLATALGSVAGGRLLARLLASPRFLEEITTIGMANKAGNLAKVARAAANASDIISSEYKTVDRLTKTFQERAPQSKAAVIGEGVEGRKIGEFAEVNPKFERNPGLIGEEKSLSPRGESKAVTAPGAPNPVEIAPEVTRRRWDKILKPKALNEYYNRQVNKAGLPHLNEEFRMFMMDAAPDTIYIGTVGDFAKEGTNFAKTSKETFNTPIYRMTPHQYDNWVGVTLTFPEFDPALQRIIIIKENLSPESFLSTLSHESTHIKQSLRESKPFPTLTKIQERVIREGPNMPYLEKFSEVQARKYQAWIDRPVNKYRTALQKAEYAKKLLYGEEGLPESSILHRTLTRGAK